MFTLQRVWPYSHELCYQYVKMWIRLSLLVMHVLSIDTEYPIPGYHTSEVHGVRILYLSNCKELVHSTSMFPPRLAWT